MAKDKPLLTAEIGLIVSFDFLRHNAFYFALLLGPVGLALFWILFPGMFKPIEIGWYTIVLLVLWQPFVEELLFRGILQGQLTQQAWFTKSLAGISRANLAISLLFVAVHFIYHPPLWALVVLFPSLIFGWFRDRYRQIYPGVFLHSFYNGCFLLFSSFLF